MNDFKRILVAVDFSKPSVKALESAITFCQQMEGILYIVYIAEMDEKKLSVVSEDEDDSVEARVLRDFENHLQSLVEKMSNGEIRALTEVEYGDPAEGTVRVAKKIKADIIVMGTHGRTGIEHMLMGSVAESVFRKSTVPVMCVSSKFDPTT